MNGYHLDVGSPRAHACHWLHPPKIWFGCCTPGRNEVGLKFGIGLELNLLVLTCTGPLRDPSGRGVFPTTVVLSLLFQDGLGSKPGEEEAWPNPGRQGCTLGY